MTRNVVCALSLGALALLVPTRSSGQTFIDVGVWTPGGGGRVVVGGPPVVYRAPRAVYVPARPIRVVQPYYRPLPGRRVGWAKKNRGYAGDVWRAEAEYQRNLARAEREYYDDLRDARRDYRRDRRW
jgi:hypothetical protein